MRAKAILQTILLSAGVSMASLSAQTYESDTLATSAGDLTITFLGRGTLMLSFGGKVFHVDPYGKLADYATLPKADAILVTHDHGDHLDPARLTALLADEPGIEVHVRRMK